MGTEQTLPSRYVGRWVGADGRLTFDIAAGSPPTVTAFDKNGNKHLDNVPAKFTPATKLSSGYAPERLDNLQLELGTANLGTTLRMLFCVESDDNTKFGGFQWVHAPEGTDIAKLRMHLDQGGSYYEAVLDPWDDFVENLNEAEGGWLRPYSICSRVL